MKTTENYALTVIEGQRLREAWQHLKSTHKDINDFVSYTEFVDTYYWLEHRIKGDGTDYWITRKYPDRNYGPGNLHVEQVAHPSCWNRIYEPAFGGEIDE